MSRCQICGVSVGRAGKDGIRQLVRLQFPGVRYDDEIVGLWESKTNLYACGVDCAAELRGLVDDAKTQPDPLDWLITELLEPVESEPLTGSRSQRYAASRMAKYIEWLADHEAPVRAVGL